MKRASVAAAVLVALGSSAGIAAQTIGDLSPEDRAVKLEEHGTLEDRQDGSISSDQLVDSIMGALEGGDSTWNRIFNNTATMGDLTCNLTSSDSGNDNQFYDVYEISVTAPETLEAEIVSGDFDTVMAIYCDPFDDANPMNNLIFYDDDGGAGTLSAFLAADAIDLTPGNSYFLVVSSFGGDMVTGDYQLDLTSPTVTIVPVDLIDFSVD